MLCRVGGDGDCAGGLTGAAGTTVVVGGLGGVGGASPSKLPAGASVTPTTLPPESMVMVLPSSEVIVLVPSSLGSHNAGPSPVKSSGTTGSTPKSWFGKSAGSAPVTVSPVSGFVVGVPYSFAQSSGVISSCGLLSNSSSGSDGGISLSKSNSPPLSGRGAVITISGMSSSGTGSGGGSGG